MEDEFYFDELQQADIDSGIVYYWYKYDRDQYYTFENAYDFDARESIRKRYFEEHSTTDECEAGFAGIIDMINDGVIRHPAYIAWERLRTMIDFTDTYRTHMEIDDWINRIEEPQKRVDILDYLIKSADIIYDSYDRGAVKHLRAMLPKHKAAAKLRKEELKRQAAEERAKNRPQQPKPDYILSLEEIIDYAENESPESAPTIRAMLRYFATEKPKWNNKTLLNQIRQIGQQVTVNGDIVHGDKVNTKVGNVEKDGIGVQENHL